MINSIPLSLSRWWDDRIGSGTLCSDVGCEYDGLSFLDLGICWVSGGTGIAVGKFFTISSEDLVEHFRTKVALDLR